jgi:hypothetical protein
MESRFTVLFHFYVEGMGAGGLLSSEVLRKSNSFKPD